MRILITKKYRGEIVSVLLMVTIGTLMFLGGNRASLDAHLFYSGENAWQFLNSLSEEQNYIYFRHEILDLGFIFAYSLFYWFLAKRTFSPARRWLAFVPGFFDLIETTSILYFLNSRDLPSELGWLGLMTSLKWLTVALLSIGLVKSLRRTKTSG